MGEATKVKGMLMKWVREDERAKATACIHAIIMSFVSISFFFAMCLMWFFVFRSSFAWSVVILFASLAVAAGIISFGRRRADQRQWIIIMGFLGVLLTVIGLVWGFFMYYQHL